MNKRAPDLHDDPLSAASAGLVALGIDRARRLDVLDVLGCLIDHADAAGEVALDEVLFAHEVELGVDKCLDAYALLEQLSIVQRSYRGWVIARFAAHHGPSGDTAASLAVLRRHLATVGTAAAIAGPPFEAQTAVTALATPRATRQGLRRARALAAGLAASAAVVVGAGQFAPQAAVSGRNVAQNSDAPATTVRHLSPRAPNPAGGDADATSPAPTTATGVTTVADPTTTVVGPAPGAVCRAPREATAITSQSAPLGALVPLESIKPAETVTAAATAAGLPVC